MPKELLRRLDQQKEEHELQKKENKKMENAFEMQKWLIKKNK